MDTKSFVRPSAADGLKGTELALHLLARTRELLGDGEFWRADAMALSCNEVPCDPLSERARYFSLAGAAARARWEIREHLAESGIGQEHVQLVMNALFKVTREYRGDIGGWRFACAVLDGMLSALEQFRLAELAQLQLRHRAV